MPPVSTRFLRSASSRRSTCRSCRAVHPSSNGSPRFVEARAPWPAGAKTSQGCRGGAELGIDCGARARVGFVHRSVGGELFGICVRCTRIGAVTRIGLHARIELPRFLFGVASNGCRRGQREAREKKERARHPD